MPFASALTSGTPPVVVPPAAVIFDTFDRTTAPAYNGGAGTPSSGTDGDYSQDGPFGYFDGPHDPTDSYDALWCDGSVLNHLSVYHASSEVNIYYPPTFEPPLESPVLEQLNGDRVFTARFRLDSVGFEGDDGYGDAHGYFSIFTVRFGLQGNDGPWFAVTVHPNDPSSLGLPGGLTLAETTWSQFGNQADGITFEPAASVSKTDWVANEWYTVKVDWHPGALFAQAKVWGDSEAEPGWMVHGYGRVAADVVFGPIAYAILGSRRNTRYSDLNTPTDALVQFDDFITVVT